MLDAMQTGSAFGALALIFWLLIGFVPLLSPGSPLSSDQTEALVDIFGVVLSGGLCLFLYLSHMN